MKVFRLGDARPIQLGQRQFVAEGGEARVFTRDGLAFKVFHEPARVPPKDKLDRLAAIVEPRIVGPLDALVDDAGRPVGLTTRFVPDAWPLGRLIPPAFRRREGVEPTQVRHLIARLRGAVRAVHASGALIVDLNELNVLVLPDFSDVRLIDVDSWQLPGHPATALLDAVRDWTRARFSEATDWFSFAVVTFQLFTGLHPFKGRYTGRVAALRGRLPTDAADDPFAVTRRRMQAGVSVFHPDVAVPAAAEPASVIPAGWRTWYRRLFAEGHRGPPPETFTAAAAVAFHAPPPVSLPAGGLEATRLDRVEGQVRRLFVDPLHRVVVTDVGVWLDGRRTHLDPGAVQACVFSPRARRPVAVDARGPVPVLTEVATGAAVPFGLAAEVVAAMDGHAWLKAGDQVHALDLTEAGDRLFASTRPVANVMPHAARLFPGVVVQSLLGAAYVSLLEADRARQIRVAALDGFTVFDARYQRGVLMVAGHRGGHYARLILRVGDDDTVDVRSVAEAAPVVPRFVVLPGGLCLSPTDDDRLELFPARPGEARHRFVDDPLLVDGPLLAEQGGAVLLARAGEVLRVRMR